MQSKGAQLKAARRERARTIRRRIIGGAVALFVATWLLITVTLASGHDPVLSRKTTTTQTTAAATTTTATSTTTASAQSTRSGSGSSSDSGSSSGTSSSSSAPSSVSTSQS